MLDEKVLGRGYNSLKEGVAAIEVSMYSKNSRQIIADLKALKIKVDIIIKYVNKNK